MIWFDVIYISGKSADSVHHVAFFAGLSENHGPIDQNTDLVLDKVITNVGGAYDKQTGRVNIPFSGLYHFTVVVAAQERLKVSSIYTGTVSYSDI